MLGCSVHDTGIGLEAALAVFAWADATPGRTAQLDVKFMQFIGAVANDPNVTKLDLRDTTFSADGAASLGRLLASSATAVTSLEYVPHPANRSHPCCVRLMCTCFLLVHAHTAPSQLPPWFLSSPARQTTVTVAVAVLHLPS